MGGYGGCGVYGVLAGVWWRGEDVVEEMREMGLEGEVDNEPREV